MENGHIRTTRQFGAAAARKDITFEEAEAAPPDPRRWLALAVVLTAAFLGPLDFFIVNVSIPAIQDNLHASPADIELMIAGYGLTYAVFLITGGRLGDIYGRKRMFMIGMASFTLTSALCGLAPTPALLIASRVLQGVAGAMMFPQVLSIIQVSFPLHERPLAFGLFGMVVGTGSFSGNVLGGLLVQGNILGLSWRPIFLVNLPLGVLALLATASLVHESRSPKALRIDPGGVALASAGLFLLIFPLVYGRELHWPPWTFVCLAASVPALAWFVLFEKRVSARGGSPLMELSLYRNKVFVAGLLTTLAYYGGLSAFFLSVTYFLQKGMGYNPMEAGFIFAPFAVGFLCASFLAVRLIRHLGSRVIQLGAALMAGSLGCVIALAHSYGIQIPTPDLVLVLLCYGVGQGLVMPTLVSTVLSGIPSHDAGSASGVLTTVQQIAVSLGVACIGSVFFGMLEGAAPDSRLGLALGAAPQFLSGIEEFPPALGAALLINIGLLIVTIALVFLLPRRITGHVSTAVLAEI